MLTLILLLLEPKILTPALAYLKRKLMHSCSVIISGCLLHYTVQLFVCHLLRRHG